MDNRKKTILIPNIIEMSVDEVVNLQQALQQVFRSGDAIRTYEIYAKLLKVFMLWSELEKQEYGTEIRPLDEIEYIIGLMKSDKLKVELIANV